MLAEAEQASPGTLQRLAEGAASGAAGGVLSDNAAMLLPWIKAVATDMGLALGVF